MACTTCPRALLARVPYVPYVPRALRVLRALRAIRALRAHVPKNILQTGKLKISVLIKSNEGSFADVFKGAEF